MSYFVQHRRRKKKSFIIFLSVIFIILLIVFISYHTLTTQYINQVNTPIDSENTQKILFQIKQNENVKVIAERLEEKGLIKNDVFFWWYLRSNKLIPDIQAGTHYLSKSDNYIQIFRELSKARPREINVTIPEGYTISQIDDNLTEKGLIEAGDFIKSTKNFNHTGYDFLLNDNMEGYLFPDTYRVFGDDFESKSLIKKMLNNFKQKMEINFVAEENSRTLQDIVIMASIIEKETISNTNRPTVSGILWKRLDQGMLIGADATTRYALDKITEPLTYEDLKSKSPYNTRKVKGLPPGAISNPGLSSLKAAINPEESEYYYYLHDASGQIHYAKTNAEHNANKQKYL